LACIALGTLHPNLGFTLSSAIQDFQDIKSGKKNANDEAINTLIMFIIWGFVGLISGILSMSFWGKAGHHLTEKLRIKCFKKMLNSDTEFFDDPNNSPGSLCGSLEEDCGMVSHMTTTVAGSLIIGITNLIFGLALSFFSSWRLTLCVLAITPLQYIAATIETKKFMQTDFTANYKDIGSSIVQENISNIRTVRAINTVDNVIEIFDEN